MKLNAVIVFCQVCILFLLSSCGEKVFDLEKNGIKKLKYQELPDKVRTFIDHNIDSIVNSNRDIYYSTNPKIEFTYGDSGSSNNWINEVSSNYHHFFVDGVHYRMRGNKGHPFILHGGFLYFGDLNIYKDDYTTRPYFKVRVAMN